LLEVDPDLAPDIDDAGRDVAMSHLVARTSVVFAGPWDPNDHGPPDPGFVGLLLLEGVLARRVSLRGGESLELLGPGQIVRPWDRDEITPEDEGETAWTALSLTHVAWLDREFLTRAMRWPDVTIQIIRRLCQRSRELARHLAISHVVGVDARLFLLLSHMAERWGRVTPDGLLLPLPLTNEMIGTIIGARRPSVSTAVRKLSDAGLVERCGDGSWLLRPRTDRRGALGAMDLDRTSGVELRVAAGT
jgi:CRP-like cAMP-binding protein